MRKKGPVQTTISALCLIFVQIRVLMCTDNVMILRVNFSDSPLFVALIFNLEQKKRAGLIRIKLIRHIFHSLSLSLCLSLSV